MSGDWVLVPREPTEAMINAAWEAYRYHSTATAVWRAMLSAAPPPPVTTREAENMVHSQLPVQAASQPAVTQAWMPIETAPEGRKVLVSVRIGEHPHTMTARFWPTGSLQVEDEFPGAEEIDGELCMPAGWYEENHGDETWINRVRPTHWMPLPLPPDDRKGGA